MANFSAIHSVAASLMTYLRNAYPESLRKDHGCSFTVLSSADLAKMDDPDTMVGLYIYRVSVNEHLRNQRPVSLPQRESSPLTVDIHFLLTIWAGSALDEHLLCGWVMREMNRRPVLDASCLSADGGWQPYESVQLVPSELTIEDLMRIWDAVAPTYRLSLSYIARAVMIEQEDGQVGLPVMATRFTYANQEPPRV